MSLLGPNAMKAKILDDNDYVYDFVRMLYINEEERKAFTWYAVNEHSPEWLQSKILES